MPKDKKKSTTSNGHAKSYRANRNNSDSSDSGENNDCTPCLNLFRGRNQKPRSASAPNGASTANGSINGASVSNGTNGVNGVNGTSRHTGATQDLLDLDISMDSNPRRRVRRATEMTPSPTDSDCPSVISDSLQGVRAQLRHLLIQSGQVSFHRAPLLALTPAPYPDVNIVLFPFSVLRFWSNQNKTNGPSAYHKQLVSIRPRNYPSWKRERRREGGQAFPEPWLWGKRLVQSMLIGV